MKALDNYVRSEYDTEATLADSVSALSIAVYSTESEPTPSNAYELCVASRVFHAAVFASLVEDGNTASLKEFMPLLVRAEQVLENACAKNPDNEAFIRMHQTLVKRVRRLITGAIYYEIEEPDTKHVFISYVRENSKDVQRLCNDLKEQGINVWLDKEKILPGIRWKSAIRKAIQDGQCFVAVFSREYCERLETYMNEELILAVEQLRRYNRDRTWFIPVLLSPCKFPDFSIGPDETLEDLHHVDLFHNWKIGVQSIVDSVNSRLNAFRRNR